jgi:hypothetical protein
MTDAQRIQRLERELQKIKSEVTDLRGSLQSAVDDLQNSVQLVFKHVRVPKRAFTNPNGGFGFD